MTVVEKLATRRRVLKGMMGGASVTVGIPFLDCFLDGNGAALAATGQALPVVYSSWYWGLGFNPGRWEPSSAGKIEQLGPEIEALDPFKDRINIYSGMQVHLDGQENRKHITAPMAVLTGTAPRCMYGTAATLDTLIADRIGATTRFRSLEMASTGNSDHMYSYRAGGQFQPGEPSPAAMYARLFGAAAGMGKGSVASPDPSLMAHQSVLSAVAEPRQEIERLLGASDRARLDEYYSSIRQLEQQICLHLERQEAAACSLSDALPYGPAGCEVDELRTNHKLFARLAAHAFACDQTRVVNLVFSEFLSTLRRAGSQMDHHLYSHEEAVDPVLGYQPNVAWFNARTAEGLVDYLTALDSIREGDKTLLDRALVFAMSDCGDARSHSCENIPMITAGSAGGRIKTGIHVAAKGDPASRVGLTIQQALGLPLNTWGTQSMATSKTIADVLA